MIMENKTTELQNKKNTAAIFSDIRQQVEDGKGFLSVCLENRKQKKRSAARKSIDDLEYALKLLGQKPTKEEYGKKERSFYWKKLTRLFEPESEIIDKQNVRCKKTRVAEKISRTNREDSGHPEYSCQTACKRIKHKRISRGMAR